MQSLEVKLSREFVLREGTQATGSCISQMWILFKRSPEFFKITTKACKSAIWFKSFTLANNGFMME